MVDNDVAYCISSMYLTISNLFDSYFNTIT
jgi:hypothetical protein